MGLEEFIARALKKTKYGRQASYPLLGVLPTEFQEKLAEDINVEKRVFTLSQIGFAAGLAIVRYYLGEYIEDYSVIGYLGTTAKLWSMQSMLTNITRLGYVAITNKPIGMLSIEIPYRVFKKVGKRVKRILEEHKIHRAG